LNYERINQWLTTVANFGVIAGIMFLVIEVRQTSTQIEQNTTAQSAQTFWQIINSSNAFRQELAVDAELARLVFSGNQDPLALSDVDRERYVQWTRTQLSFLEAYWLSYEKGLLDDRDAAGMRGSICERFEANGVVWVWKNRPGNYADGFGEVVEDLCLK